MRACECVSDCEKKRTSRREKCEKRSMRKEINAKSCWVEKERERKREMRKKKREMREEHGVCICVCACVHVWLRACECVGAHTRERSKRRGNGIKGTSKLYHRKRFRMGIPGWRFPFREMGERREACVKIKKYISFFFFFILRARTGWQGFVAMPLSVTHPFCLYKN